MAKRSTTSPPKKQATSTVLEVDGRQLKLTNVEKVLYPETGFTKGQVIEYYADVSTVILAYLRNRAVTFKRYPDGVDAEFFYQKNCPESRPAWLDRVEVPRQSDPAKTTSYCMLNNTASLIWAANLAAIEFHPLLSTRADLLKPTSMVFDLDPGPDRDMNDCAAIALRLRTHLEELKLECWAKTSGSKGLHVWVPLNTECSFDETKSVARALADVMAEESPHEVTVNMRKSERKGRIFVDWSQNDDHKTTVSAYSLRATSSPRVSTPITWEEVEKLSRPRTRIDAFEFGPEQVRERLNEHGDLFQPVLKLKQYLPHLRKTETGKRPVSQKKVAEPAPMKQSKSTVRATSSSKRNPTEKKATASSALRTYRQKRDFKQTPEPVGGSTANEDSHFVIQQHAARSLHYDFRLEVDGVLKSWAVPKGPSIDPKVQRLAVRTEDHPLEYAEFEGTIPKGQYGGGTVMVWDRGNYRNAKTDDRGNRIPITESLKRGSMQFELRGKKLKGAYQLIRTSSGTPENWLLRKVADRYSKAGADILKARPRSASTGRSLQQIEKGRTSGR